LAGAGLLLAEAALLRLAGAGLDRPRLFWLVWAKTQQAILITFWLLRAKTAWLSMGAFIDFCDLKIPADPRSQLALSSGGCDRPRRFWLVWAKTRAAGHSGCCGLRHSRRRMCLRGFPGNTGEYDPL
jgi:hypothetical protein